MKLNHVLVVFKHRVTSISEEPGGESLKARLSARQNQHDAAIESARTALLSLGIPHRFVDRDHLPQGLGGDLIITIGGDGTFLATAHLAGETPMLGMNSMPGHSVGFFCAANAKDIAAVLYKIRTGNLKKRSLPLIEANIDGKPLPHFALNEILFAPSSAAETARYEIRVRGKAEAQKSSGVWVAAGPGSTAAILSAGGKKLPLASKRLQFLVRETCPLPKRNHKLLRGILDEGEKLSVISEMSNGMAFIDGPRLAYPVPFGSKLTVSIARKTLKVFI